MTRFSNRISSFILASGITAALFGVAGNQAFAANAPAYRLIPVAAVASASHVIVNETLWMQTANGYVAKSATSRPAVVCAQAARKVGKIASFEANGTAFTAEELEKCNAKAK
jgi:hypothetical protein